MTMTIPASMDISVEAQSLLIATSTVAKAVGLRRKKDPHYQVLVVANRDGVRLIAATPQLRITVPVQGTVMVSTPGATWEPLVALLNKLAKQRGTIRVRSLTSGDARNKTPPQMQAAVTEQAISGLLPAIPMPGEPVTMAEKGQQWVRLTSLILAQQEQKATIPRALLTYLVRQVAYAVETDPRPRPPLAGILFEARDGRVTLTGADAFRLACCSHPCVAQFSTAVILPPDALRAVLRVFAPCETLSLVATVLTEQVIAQDERPISDAHPHQRIARLSVRGSTMTDTDTTSIDLVPLHGTYPDAHALLMRAMAQGKPLMVSRNEMQMALDRLPPLTGQHWERDRVTVQIADGLLHMQSALYEGTLPPIHLVSPSPDESAVSITVRCSALVDALHALKAIRRTSSDELLLHCTGQMLHLSPRSTADSLEVCHVIVRAP